MDWILMDSDNFVDFLYVNSQIWDYGSNACPWNKFSIIQKYMERHIRSDVAIDTMRFPSLCEFYNVWLIVTLKWVFYRFIWLKYNEDAAVALYNGGKNSLVWFTELIFSVVSR